MNKNIKISKLDAAKRQLETAIRLYFNEADPVSIHTLVGAAHGILSDLNKKRGGKPMIVSDYSIKEEYKKEIRKKLKEAINHFKHADQAPNAVIDFNPEINDDYIYDACAKYGELTGENVPYFMIFFGWFASKNINVFIFTPEHRQKIIDIQCINKVSYFSGMLSVSGHLT